MKSVKKCGVHGCDKSVKKKDGGNGRLCVTHATRARLIITSLAPLLRRSKHERKT